MLDLNQIFPNLKIFQLSFYHYYFLAYCYLNDAHWKVIIDHVKLLKHIQALYLSYLLVIFRA